MQRRILTLLAVLALAVGLAACGSSSKSSNSSSSGNSSTASTSDIITIKNFAFSAATVKAGATVTVKNTDPTTHTVKSDDGKFDTGDIAANSSATFTAPSAPGTYKFHCNIHTYMKGTLTVTA